jgi:hypothetical protein
VLADPEPLAAVARRPISALSQQTQLTHLSISGFVALGDEFLLSLSYLTDLQQLSLRPCESRDGVLPHLFSASSASLSSLQHMQRLTALDLGLHQLDSMLCPSLTELTALQHLRLAGAELDVALLPQCPGLVDLQLVQVYCLDNTAKHMLSYLSSLTQLSRMQLSEVKLKGWHSWRVKQRNKPSAAAACSAYTALAASSRLKHWSFEAGDELGDLNDPDEYHGLPAAAWDQFFGTGLQQAGLEIESLELDQVPFKQLSFRSQYAALRQLKSLQKLALSKCSMDSEVLSALTQLTYLKLATVDVSTGDDDRDYAHDSEEFDEDEYGEDEGEDFDGARAATVAALLLSGRWP